MMMDFDYGFDNMLSRFDRQFSTFDRMFDNLRKVEMQLGGAVDDLDKEMECDDSQPEIKLASVTSTPEHHRYDFSLKNVDVENVNVNAYEDRYSGSCYLSVNLQDNKASDKIYEYSLSPEGKVLGKKLLSVDEVKLLRNGPQDQQQQKQLEGSTANTANAEGGAASKVASGNGNANGNANGNGNATAEDSSKKTRKHYVHLRSSGSKMNTMSYRLPEDVSERELVDIKTEHNSSEGGNVLSLYIPRPRHVVRHRWVNGTKVLHIPVNK